MLSRSRSRGWLRTARRGFIRARAEFARFNDTPHAVGLGLAIGVFASFLPIFGLQMLSAALLARVVRASMGAAVLGTFVGNPLTWPMMWAASYAVGTTVLGSGGDITHEELRWAMERLWLVSALTVPEAIEASRTALWSVLKPLTVGSILLGLTTAGVFYYIARRATEIRQALP